MTVSKRPARRITPEPREVVEEISEDGEEEEAPAPRTKSAGTAGIRGGWTEGQRQMDSTSKFAQTLRAEEKSQIIKFLDDAPYANFKRHWIKRQTKEQGVTNRPYTCPRTFDMDKPCPVCEVGDKPQAVAAFNVALVGDDGQVLLKSFDTTPRTFAQVKGYANDPKIGPLTKGYFLVNKVNTGGNSSFTGVHPVKASSLEEDYDVTPPDPDELARLDKYGPDIIDAVDMKTLREIAEEIADEYE